MRRGLTLLEVLVVVLVVGVAGLILYPVFANAREAGKRSVCFANLRTLGRAIAGYVEANDGTYPLAFIRRESGWDWRGGARVPARNGPDASVWINALLPFLDTPGYLACPQGLLAAEAAVPISYTMNGLMHALPFSRVTRPEDAPILWEGMGRSVSDGVSRANPILECTDAARDCRFSQIGYPKASLLLPAASGDASMWVHGRGSDFLMADLHAKWKRMGSKTGGSVTPVGKDPYKTYSAGGNPRTTWPAETFFEP